MNFKLAAGVGVLILLLLSLIAFLVFWLPSLPPAAPIDPARPCDLYQNRIETTLQNISSSEGSVSFDGSFEVRLSNGSTRYLASQLESVYEVSADYSFKILFECYNMTTLVGGKEATLGISFKSKELGSCQMKVPVEYELENRLLIYTFETGRFVCQEPVKGSLTKTLMIHSFKFNVVQKIRARMSRYTPADMI